MILVSRHIAAKCWLSWTETERANLPAKGLNGDYQPDKCEYSLDGVQKRFRPPHEAIEEGISIIYQERHIFLIGLSVAENIYLGRMSVKLQYIDHCEIPTQFGRNIRQKRS